MIGYVNDQAVSLSRNDYTKILITNSRLILVNNYRRNPPNQLNGNRSKQISPRWNQTLDYISVIDWTKLMNPTRPKPLRDNSIKPFSFMDSVSFRNKIIRYRISLRQSSGERVFILQSNNFNILNNSAAAYHALGVNGEDNALRRIVLV